MDCVCCASERALFFRVDSALRLSESPLYLKGIPYASGSRYQIKIHFRLHLIVVSRVTASRLPIIIEPVPFLLLLMGCAAVLLLLIIIWI